MDELGQVGIALRLLAAIVSGGLIGVEREADGQDAGLRTHMLVSLGAGVLGLLSVGAFGSFVMERADTNVQVDVTRVASYVAAGLGFIAGGVIVKHPDGVSGLTTAASLWTAGAIGLAAGLGSYGPVVAATILAIATLAALRPLRRVIRRWIHADPATAVFCLSDSADLGNFVAELDHLALKHPHTVTIEAADEADGHLRTVTVGFGRVAPREVRSLLASLLDDEAVVTASFGSDVK